MGLCRICSRSCVSLLHQLGNYWHLPGHINVGQAYHRAQSAFPDSRSFPRRLSFPAFMEGKLGVLLPQRRLWLLLDLTMAEATVERGLPDPGCDSRICSWSLWLRGDPRQAVPLSCLHLGFLHPSLLPPKYLLHVIFTLYKLQPTKISNFAEIQMLHLEIIWGKNIRLFFPPNLF